MSAFVLEGASSSTPTPPMRAGWTASGACNQWLDARPPRGATRRASGGVARRVRQRLSEVVVAVVQTAPY